MIFPASKNTSTHQSTGTVQALEPGMGSGESQHFAVPAQNTHQPQRPVIIKNGEGRHAKRDAQRINQQSQQVD